LLAESILRLEDEGPGIPAIDGQVLFLKTPDSVLKPVIADTIVVNSNHFDLLSNHDVHVQIADFFGEVLRTEWPQPPAFPNTKIIWGYWDTGESSLAGFAKLCIASWRAKHPTWEVIVLSEDNYKNFVAAEDVPSTYKSLIAQHKSDILRTAILKRHGGVYMDITTLIFRSFDSVWDDPAMPVCMFVPGVELEDGVHLTNNALIVAREKNHPIMKEIHRRYCEYCEAPCMSIEDMRSNKNFVVTSQFWDNPTMGVSAVLIEYCALVFILDEVISCTDTLRQVIARDAKMLSARENTFDTVVLSPLPVKLTRWEEDALMRSAVDLRKYVNCYDEFVVQELERRNVNCFKISSDELKRPLAGLGVRPAAELLQMQTTMGHLLRKAVSTQSEPWNLACAYPVEWHGDGPKTSSPPPDSYLHQHAEALAPNNFGR